MRTWILLALVACKGKEPLKQSPAVDWNACEAALKKASTAPLDSRPQIVIDGCQVCGDWKPILHWATPEQDGGPKRTEIDAAMQRCGYCDANGKQRFLGTLDNARGTDARTPWRQLGEMCKEKVSAAPDGRFMSAPYYALDRIARAAGAKGDETKVLLAALELPLPAVTSGGTGVVLPEVTTEVMPGSSELAITLLGEETFIGQVPRAKLGADGVAVVPSLDGYPGKKVTDGAELVARLHDIASADPKASIVVLAPSGMRIHRLRELVAAITDGASPLPAVYLGVGAPDSLPGWQLVATLPYPLRTGRDGLSVSDDMTIQNVADEIAAKHSGTLSGP